MLHFRYSVSISFWNLLVRTAIGGNWGGVSAENYKLDPSSHRLSGECPLSSSQQIFPTSYGFAQTLGSVLHLPQTSGSLPPYGQWRHLVAKPKVPNYLFFLCLPHSGVDGVSPQFTPESSPSFCPSIPSLLLSSLTGTILLPHGVLSAEARDLSIAV